MPADPRALGRKVRLNVAAVDEGEVVGKFLVIIDEELMVGDLERKVSQVLNKKGVPGKLVQLNNGLGALIPSDEAVADVLRDGEEVVALMTQKVTPRDPLRGVGELLSFGGAEPSAAPGPVEAPPGPAELFEVPEASANQEPVDWEVAELTPKLREFVSTRFKEAHGAVADPGHSFITVSMRPKDRYSGSVSIQPVHYKIARIDIIEFERLSGRKIQEARRRQDYFQRCREALGSLVDRGASWDEYAPNMMPYSYRGDEEIGSLLNEADSDTFGQVEGFRPLIVIDTAGALGESLPFIRAAMKRMLYSFIVAKSKFNMIKLSTQGRSAAFESTMVPPTAQKLREAEEWLDATRPGRSGGGDVFLEGMQHALDFYEADMVYLLTSGLPRKSDTDYVISELGARNVRGVPIHVIGVDCDMKAELELRKLAEENQGSFRQKRFDGGLCSTELRVPPLMGGQSDGRLTIGGQLDILEIMEREQQGDTDVWVKEQECANRLLLTTATQQPVPDPQHARSGAALLEASYLSRGPNPRMQELIEGLPRGTAAARRGAGQPAQRASSQPRAAAGRMSQTASELRRPSIANPWDRPSGIVKASQLGSEKSFGPCPPGVGTGRVLFAQKR